MGKILFWVVLVFAVLFAVRLIGSAQAKKRRERADAPPPAKGADMVRCARCGTFVPRADAIEAPGGYRCREGACLPRGNAG